MASRSGRTTTGTSGATPTGYRAARAAATRELLITTAERLFAEQGIHAVSNRTIAQAAGQGNNTVVGYHFGTKADLVAAIVRKHAVDVDRRRARLLEQLPPDPGLRDWVGCLVTPFVEHFTELGTTWYGRCVAQIWTDPVLRAVVADEAQGSAALTAVLRGIGQAMPASERARADRATLLRIVVVHAVAECEQRVFDGLAEPREAWAETGEMLVDAVVAICSTGAALASGPPVASS